MVSIRLRVGARVSNLCVNEEALFNSQDEVKKESVHRAVDEIRKKFGDVSICRAASK